MGANIFPGTRAIKEDIVRMFEKRRDSLMNLQDAGSNNQLRLTQLVLQERQINADDLDRINITTLILAGESDVIKTEHTMLIHALIKSSRAEILADEDHYLPLKNPGLFNKLYSISLPISQRFNDTMKNLWHASFSYSMIRLPTIVVVVILTRNIICCN